MNKTDVQAFRQCLSETADEPSVGFQTLLLKFLLECLDAQREALQEIEGELMCILLLLDTKANINQEIKIVAAELKMRFLRLIKTENRILRGTDNTDILKDKRDAEGYITDLTLMRSPYSIQRIQHRDNPTKEFVEEIYIDALGRYFRRIYDFKELDETESAIAENILSEFDVAEDKKDN